jgi:hypothetical protein
MKLFDPDNPPNARNTDPWTSHAAGQPTGSHERLRNRVVALLRSDGPLTDYELSTRLGALRGTTAKRRLDAARLGLIVNSGERRPTDTGSTAIAWRAVAPDEPGFDEPVQMKSTNKETE